MEKKNAAQLLLILKRFDRERARIISESNSERKNARRIIRAVEVAVYKKKELEGRRSKRSTCRSGTSTRDIERSTLQDKYAPIFIGIKPENEDLKKRIQIRLENRLKHGMIAEARRLRAHGLSWKRMDELGLEYRYMARFLQGEMSKEEFVKKLNTEIWHYARRQMTWFRRNPKIRWFGLRQETGVDKTITRTLKN
jgi:tRNA dimethylallyltransferase